MKNRPKGTTPEEWNKVWDNSGYALESLWVTLLELKKENEGVKKEDFDCPNHYAKLAYQAGINKALDQVIGLLPASAKPL